MTQPARVLAWISNAEPWGAVDPPESPVERAAHSALMAVADFYIAIKQASTVDEVWTLARIIGDVEASVASAARSARLKADAINGAKE